MTYENFVKLFVDETAGIFIQHEWLDLQDSFSSLVLQISKMPEPLGKKMIKEFVKCVAEGTVTKELFEHNIKIFVDTLNMYHNNQIKELLNSHLNPTLYMDETEISDKIVEKFIGNLKKTEEVEKSASLSGGGMEDLLSGLMGSMQNPGSAKFTPKKKSKKRK